MAVGKGKKRQRTDYDESGLQVHPPEDHAAGPTAVAVSMKRSLERMGTARTVRTLLRLNQADWTHKSDPEPKHQS